MTLTKSVLYFGAILAILSIVYLLGASAPRVGASAPAGIAATVATTSNPTIGTIAATLFATSSCSSRIITTYASPITLTFSDYIGQTPTGTFGHLQAASTTVVYDATVYGCGLYKAFGFSSTAITVSETR